MCGVNDSIDQRLRGVWTCVYECTSACLTPKITHKHLTAWTLWHAQMKMQYSAVWWWFTPDSEKQSAFPIRRRTSLCFSFARRLHRRRAKFPAIWVSSKHGRWTGLTAKGDRKWVCVLSLSATFNLSVCSLVISGRKLTNVQTDASERQIFSIMRRRTAVLIPHQKCLMLAFQKHQTWLTGLGSPP